MVDPAAAAQRIRAANEQEREQLAKRRRDAQITARELAEILINNFPQAIRVWGFGSTFETWRSYRFSSDIDIAVEAGDLLEMLPFVESCGYPVDVVCLQDTTPDFAAFVRANGTVLAETPPDQLFDHLMEEA